MAAPTLQDLLALDVETRLALVQELWDSIAEDSKVPKLDEAEGQLLDERVAAHRRHPNAAQPWSIVKRRVVAKLKARRRK